MSIIEFGDEPVEESPHTTPNSPPNRPSKVVAYSPITVRNRTWSGQKNFVNKSAEENLEDFFELLACVSSR